MRIRLKGINHATKRLANGRTVTYWYAWRNGPSLRGKPGSPEFVASYNEAVARKVTPPAGVLFSILHGYQASEAFRGLAKRSRDDYAAKIRLIEKAFGDFPLSALSDRRTRGVFRAWRDKLALSSHRQADYAWAVLARVLSWALEGGIVPVNPCERGGRLYGGSRADKIWSLEDEANFLKSAPAHLHLPLLLALWTGQRQGDLLRLAWSAYDGKHIRLLQSKSIRARRSKSGVRVKIPIGAPLKAALDAAARGEKGPFTTILVNSQGKPWTSDGFRSSWRKACTTAGVVGVTFHDLRGTAVTRLAIAECTEAQIAAITGHSLRDVRTILDSHYLHRDPALAESAIRKLERGTKTPN